MIRNVSPPSGAHEGAVDEEKDLSDDVLLEDDVFGGPSFSVKKTVVTAMCLFARHVLETSLW